MKKNQIETNRTILRNFQENDLLDFFEYASVEGVGEAAGWPHHKSIEDSQKILDMFINSNEVYAIYHKNDKKVIGSIGLHRKGWTVDKEELKQYNKIELGYVLSKSYWGQGIMHESASALLEYAFNNGIELISCNHFLENKQSQRVIEKLGFKYDSNGIFHSSQMNKDFEEKRYLLWK